MAYPDIVSSQRDLFERRRQLQAQELSGLEESMKLAKQQQDLVEELTKTGDASLSEVLKTRGQVNEIQSTIVNKRNAYRQKAQADIAKNRGDPDQAPPATRQRQQALTATPFRAPMSVLVKNIHT